MFDGVTWDVETDDVLVLSDAGSNRGAVALGINDAGQIVGRFETGDEGCIEQAAFWESSTAAVLDLGAVGFDALEPSYANRIGPLKTDGSVSVVGRAAVANVGVLRTRDATGAWTSLVLQSQISPLCSLEYREATDINSDGWIVGIAIRSGVEKAVLLRPLPCPADLNGDCIVDASDLGVLLGGWTCQTCDCNLDLNLDGAIDSVDLGVLLGDWDCTCGSPCDEVPEAAQMLGPATPPSLQDALLALGFEDVQAFNEWRAQAPAESGIAALDCLWSILMAGQPEE